MTNLKKPIFLILLLLIPALAFADDIEDSYSETNVDGYITLDQLSPGTDSWSGSGQAFTAASTFNLTSAKFYLKKTGSPTGTGYAKLYAATGTVGTNATVTGAALATSAGFDVSTLSTTAALITFTFDGSYQPQSGSSYCIVYENPTSGTFDVNNTIGFGTDASTPSHAGNWAYKVSGAWGGVSGRDVAFYIYGTVPSTGQVIIIY